MTSEKYLCPVCNWAYDPDEWDGRKEVPGHSFPPCDGEGKRPMVPVPDATSTMGAPKITEDWLRDCGFKWEQVERQPSKHWVLWIGSACLDYDRTNSPDALGIELAKVDPPGDVYKDLWFCWIRSDIAGRYARLIHVRYVYLQAEVESIIAALTGRAVDWRNSMYGSLHSPKQAEHLMQDRMRLDQRINHAWVDRVDAEKGITGIDKDKRCATLP